MLHVVEQGAQSVLSQFVIIIVAIPNIQRGLQDTWTNSAADAPGVLEFSKSLDGECIHILAILAIPGVDNYASDGDWDEAR